MGDMQVSKVDFSNVEPVQSTGIPMAQYLQVERQYFQVLHQRQGMLHQIEQYRILNIALVHQLEQNRILNKFKDRKIAHLARKVARLERKIIYFQQIIDQPKSKLTKKRTYKIIKNPPFFEFFVQLWRRISLFFKGIKYTKEEITHDMFVIVNRKK